MGVPGGGRGIVVEHVHLNNNLVHRDRPFLIPRLLRVREGRLKLVLGEHVLEPLVASHEKVVRSEPSEAAVGRGDVELQYIEGCPVVRVGAAEEDINRCPGILEDEPAGLEILDLRQHLRRGFFANLPARRHRGRQDVAAAAQL